MDQEREYLFRYRDGISESTIHTEIENPRSYRRDPAVEMRAKPMAEKSSNATVVGHGSSIQSERGAEAVSEELDNSVWVVKKDGSRRRENKEVEPTFRLLCP